MTRSRRIRRRVLAFATAVALGATAAIVAVAAPIGPVSSASAAPGTPGTPQAPTVVYNEDFENTVSGSMNLLTSYTSASGLGYTADAPWLINCNGVVLNGFSVGNAPNCGVITDRLRTLSRALGQLRGVANLNTNNSLSAYTDNGSGGAADPGANLIQFATTTPISLPPITGKRYLGFSVDGAVDNYGANPPQYQFYFVNGANVTPVGSPINAGTDPRGTIISLDGRGIRMGTYATNAAVAVTGNQVGLQLRNLVGSGAGNDGAVDNITVLDMTPQLDKSFSPTTVLAGGTSTLTFTITNTSELGAKPGWTFTDNLPAGLTVAGAAPTSTCANGTVTAPIGATSVSVGGDLNQGQASCTVTVTVTSPVAGAFTNGPGNIVPNGVQLPGTSTVNFISPAITLAKSASPSTVTAAGQTVTYTFHVTNSGDADLTNVSVAEGAFSGTGTPPTATCPPGTLAPGASVDCTATYTVTQADMDAGAVITNSATASGTPPVGPAVTSTPSTATVTPTAAPAIDLTKSATPNDAASFVVGQLITYTFVITNSGNVTLSGVGVNETNFTGSGALGPITCGGVTTLAPGDQATCTATYTLSQADVDAGTVINSATASGTPPTGGPITSTESTVTIPAAQAPELTFAKSADTSGLSSPSARAGDVLTYTFTATNSGNVSLNTVTITDPLPGLSALTYSWPGTVGVLLPGQTVTATATYALTQNDIDAGHIANNATAVATPPTGPPLPEVPAGTDTPLPAGPSLTITKTADASGVQTPGQVGDTIAYSFTIVNDGNVTLTGVSITDALPGLTAPVYTWPGAAGVLAPGETATATASYALTQADLDAGQVANSATASGTPPTGGPVTSDPSTTTTPIAPGPELTLEKTADASGIGSPAQVGDVVTYSFIARNTGTVTLSGVTIDDTLVGLSTITYTWPGAVGVLAPNQEVTATATYAIQQFDIDAGHVANAATANGTSPGGASVPSDQATTDTPLPVQPGILLEKTADASAVGSPAHVGDIITYTFSVTNTGNVTLANVVVNDPLPGLTPVLYAWPGIIDILEPGQTVTGSANYAITQADIDSGHVANLATAQGTPPSATEPLLSEPVGTDTALPRASSLTLAKSVSPTTAGRAGDTVTYSYLVTNTGTVTLSAVSIAETTFTGTGTPPAATCPAGSLAPNAQTTCTATYTLTQADVDAGTVDNTATASGQDPQGGTTTSATSTATVTAPPAAALTLVKSATPSGPEQFVAGQQVTYSFVVTNSGNVTVSDIAIAETAFTGTGTPPAATCPTGPLAPGAQLTCTATYTLTQADVDAGEVQNTATASGTAANGPDPESPSSSVSIPESPAPALSLVKTADRKTIGAVGQVVTYTFTITNSGNVTMHDVTAVEGTFSGVGKLGPITCPPAAATLLPGQVVACTATYTVQAADLASPTLKNTASASGTDPDGNTVTSDPSTATVTVSAPPAPPGGLPFTGSTVPTLLVGLTALLLALGASVALATRRRGRKTEA